MRSRSNELKKNMKRRSFYQEHACINATYIYVASRIVLYELACKVLARFSRSRRHLWIVLPVPGGWMPVQGGRRCMCYPCVCHYTSRFTYRKYREIELSFNVCGHTRIFVVHTFKNRYKRNLFMYKISNITTENHISLNPQAMILGSFY